MSINQVLELMAECTGRTPRIERLKVQNGDMRATYADTIAARDALGFSPTVTLAEGIAAEYRWIVETDTAG